MIHAAASVSRNVVVSLVAGSAITVEEWYEEVPAIIETFYNGMEGGTALARILFGDVNPSGKLPFTVPKAEADLPPFNSFDANVEYGYYHGYTLFDKEKEEPRYPFGFGLSYTSFEISELNIFKQTSQVLETWEVSVKVKNTGTKAGAEVIQLYISIPDSKIDRPEKLLRGFRKVYLQAKQEQVVNFTIPTSELAYYNLETKSWKVEPGAYSVLVGNSSRDANTLNTAFEVN